MRLRSDIILVSTHKMVVTGSSSPKNGPRHASHQKIIHLIGSVHPKAGGPSTVVVRLAAAQAALGYDVTILSFLNPDNREAFEKAACRVPGFDRVRLVLNPTSHSTVWMMKSAHRSLLRAEVSKADIVHLHGVWEPMLLMAARAAKKAKIPYVVRPCGMLDPWSLRQHSMKKQVALASGYRAMLNNAACLHVLNADEKRLIDRLGLTCKKAVIPNGVFLEEIHPLPANGTFYAKHPELKGRPYVLFLSRLHHKKGLDFLLESFKRVAAKLPEVQLVVAGPDDGAAAAFNRDALASGLSDRIHMVGALYGDEKLAALSDATLFCLPSRQEGFSLATSEALACGLPVVVSEACHFPEVAKVGAGRVVDLEPASIASAMIEILSNPVLRVAMGKAGRQMMESRFTWPVVAERCEGMYAAAVGRPVVRQTWRDAARKVTMPMMHLGRFAYHLF